MGVNGIYGLSGSGLDIESMVKVGMMSRQNEYDKMAQKYTKNEWTKTALLDINNQITTFNMSTLTDYKLSSNMNARNAESSDETALKATANATSPLMSHKVTVTKLSSNAYLIGSNTISDIIASTKNISNTSDEAKSLASTAKLSDILFNNLKEGSTKITSTYDSRNVVNNAGDPFNDFTIYSKSNTITHTGIKISNDGSITAKYKDTEGTIHTYSDSGAQTKIETTNTYQNGSSTLTVTGIKNPTDTDFIYAIEGYTSVVSPYNSNNITFSKSGSNDIILTKNSDGSIASIQEKVPRSPSIFPPYYDYNSYTDVSGTKIETTEYNGGSKVTVTTNTTNGTETSKKTDTAFKNGSTNINISETTTNGNVALNSAQTITYENGITGMTLKKNDGNPRIVSYGFTDGQNHSVSRDDVALEFTIADSKEAGAAEAKITITYGDILGDAANNKSPLTMTTLASKINEAAGKANLNVRVNYDNINERFSIYNSKGDVDSSIVITATSSDNNALADGTRTYTGQITTAFFDALGLKNFDGEMIGEAMTMTGNGMGGGKITATGQNGNINVDGIDYATKDNKVTVGGVTYNALNKTKDAAGNIAAVTVTVGQDADAIVDKVKSFIDNYNKILASLYEKYDEKADSNYKPLTQAQKDSMKDEQIEKWEEKAKQGLLYHDQTLGKIINDMRNSISMEIDGVNGKYTSAYSIGISTTGIKGQLVLDETKLRNALADDGDSVYKVFASLDNDAKPGKNGIVAENGIAQRLGDIFTSATKLIKSRAGSSADIAEDSDLNNLLRELQTKMSNFKKLMSAFEDRLYKKYDAMETALAKLGMQLNFINGGQ